MRNVVCACLFVGNWQQVHAPLNVCANARTPHTPALAGSLPQQRQSQVRCVYIAINTIYVPDNAAAAYTQQFIVARNHVYSRLFENFRKKSKLWRIN